MPNELDRLLDGLSTIDVASVFVERLSEDVPTPSAEVADADLAFVLLAERAKGLYANFEHSLSSPAEFAPLLAIRPLIELAVVVKWISLDPEFHGLLWVSDSDASELTHLDAMLAHAKRRGSPEPSFDPSHRLSREAMRDEARARLRAAGRNYGKNRTMPSAIRMVEEVEKAIPEHKIAMRDAYEYAYRTFSPWQHSATSSFNATARRTGPDAWVWLGDRSPFTAEAMHAIAVSMYAYVLEVVLSQRADHDGAKLARAIRDHVVLRWVPSDTDPSQAPPGYASGDSTNGD
jgi:hypothetical protein